MREVRGEVGKKTPKKDMDNLSMLRRHMADFFWIPCPVTIFTVISKLEAVYSAYKTKDVIQYKFYHVFYFKNMRFI